MGYATECLDSSPPTPEGTVFLCGLPLDHGGPIHAAVATDGTVTLTWPVEHALHARRCPICRDPSHPTGRCPRFREFQRKGTA
jgi:hypothetical protein